MRRASITFGTAARRLSSSDNCSKSATRTAKFMVAIPVDESMRVLTAIRCTLAEAMTPDVAAALGIGRASKPEEVAAQSDFVSVHVSLTAETRGFLGAKFFEAMRPGAVLINTSRAEVVDQGEELVERDALAAALDYARANQQRNATLSRSGWEVVAP